LNFLTKSFTPFELIQKLQPLSFLKLGKLEETSWVQRVKADNGRYRRAGTFCKGFTQGNPMHALPHSQGKGGKNVVKYSSTQMRFITRLRCCTGQ
jgi:hypothetical protein